MIVHSNASEPWKVTLVDTGKSTQTGGRIKQIKDYVQGERFMITYGDGVSNVDLNALINQHVQTKMTATLTAIQPGGRFGVLDVEDKTITAFKEKAKEDGGWINAGFMVAEPEIFDYIEDDRTIFEREPLERLAAERKLVFISITSIGSAWTHNVIRKRWKRCGGRGKPHGKCGRINKRYYAHV